MGEGDYLLLVGKINNVIAVLTLENYYAASFSVKASMRPNVNEMYQRKRLLKEKARGT